MAWQNKNFAYSTLNGGVLIGAGTMAVTDGSVFPTTGDFMCVVWDQSYANPSFDASRELVLCTARSTNTITITRAQEGTSAKAWNSGDKVAHVYTAALLDALVYLTGVQTLTDKTLVTPTIASFVNAAHTHLNAAGGGNLSAAAITSGLLALARGGLNVDVTTLTGLLKLTAGVASVMTPPSSTIVGISDTQTLSNKTITGGAWANITLNTGWSIQVQPQYMKDPLGFLHFGGMIHTAAAGTYLSAWPSTSLPTGYKPERTFTLPIVWTTSFATGTFEVRDTGEGAVGSYPAQGCYVLLDAIPPLKAA